MSMFWILFAVYLAGAMAMSIYLLSTVMILIYQLEQKQLQSFSVYSWSIVVRVVFWPVVFIISVVQNLLEEV